MASATEDVVTHSPSNVVDDQAHAHPKLPQRLSIVDRFLEVRGLERKKPTPTPETTKRGTVPAATLARIPPRTLWHGYTKRRHGDRAAFARRAMRSPDETYSDSTDVYNPKKRAMTFIKVHEDADDVNRQFWYRARCLFFEREVVDRPVCDLMENQAWLDDALDRVHFVSDDDDGGGDDVGDGIAPHSEDDGSGGTECKE